MSYRVHLVNNKGESFQIFGNGVGYQPLFDFIISEGGTVDEDGCFSHTIKDVDKLIRVFEQYVLDFDKRQLDYPEKYRTDIYNLRPDEYSVRTKSLTFHALNLMDNGIMFVSASAVKFWNDDLIRKLDDDWTKIKYNFSIRPGHTIRITGN